MLKVNFPEAIERILRKDQRYEREAYFFLREALDYTVRLLNKPAQGPRRHVTGKELLEGVREFALEEYGPMALRVLHTWGIASSEDIGNIVFNLVAQGVLGKTNEDRLEDFSGGYDFAQAFAGPFLPRRSAPPPGGERTPQRKPDPARRQPAGGDGP
jgi:uncharacterized repeat protein (TIGR04138 family)